MSGTGCYVWVPLNLTGRSQLGEMTPEGAVLGGWEYGKPTYVARVKHEGHWELGKLNAWARFGYSLYGKEHESAEGEVLVAHGGQSPVWINSGYGEEIEDVLTSKAVDHTQIVGRVWHKMRWVPGKVVPHCGRLFFAWGGKELSARKYQLLSTDFTWEARRSGDSCSLRDAVPVDSCMPIDSGNCLELECHDHHTPLGRRKTLARSSLLDCSWVVSGDGDYVRHAVTNEDGHVLARVWLEGGKSLGQWVAGCVVAGSSYPGLYAAGCFHANYQVLTASTVSQQVRGRQPEVSRLLSLSISLDTLEGMLENELTPPESIFMITKLEPGERPWSAVREMVSQHNESKVAEHLRPMMSVIEDLAAKEGVEIRQRQAAPASLLDM